MNSDCGRAHESVWVKLRQNPCTEEGYMQSANPTVDVFVLDACWKRENWLSLTQCLWVYQPHSRAAHAQEHWVKTNDVWFFSALFDLFVWIYLFTYFVLERETKKEERGRARQEQRLWQKKRECEVGWTIGWESWGRVKNMIKIYSMKILNNFYFFPPNN